MDERRAESEADGDSRVDDLASSGRVAARDGEGGVGCNRHVIRVNVAGEVGAAPRGIYGALFVVVPPSMESIVCDVSL